MKTWTKRLYLFLALTGVGFVACGPGQAQTFTYLYSFSARDTNYLNSDGVYPPGVILSGNTLYGTATYGGTNDGGTVFAVDTGGTGFINLHNFEGLRYTGSDPVTNNNGAGPIAGLVLSQGTLYGTTYYGGTSGLGTVFGINTDGTGFTNLHDFAGGSDGEQPFAGLVTAGNTLYGTTGAVGTGAFGSGGYGTVFAINTDGTGYTNLHNFSGGDGRTPVAGLTISGNTLYGTTQSGGTNGFGTVFAVNTDGSAFTNLYSFTPVSGIYYEGGTNNDGAYPIASLIISSNTLYGAAQYGGTNGAGTIFKVNTDGTGFKVLYSFEIDAAGGEFVQFLPNNDGANPGAGLVLNGDTLYGKSQLGGTAGLGTIFALNTDGSGFTNLYNFIDATDGLNPTSGLILSGNALYGTSLNGGATTNGAIFRLSFAPQLTLTPAGTNVLLSWPTNVAGFDYTGYTLQSATAIGSSANWSTILSPPLVVNGQCMVTNPVCGAQMFYRLSH